MNYKEFQNRNKPESNFEPADPKKYGKKFKEPTDWSKFWDFLAEAANPFSILSVLSMVVFGMIIREPLIPGILCIITFILFYIRFERKKCVYWLPIIWIFNGSIWLLNAIFL